MGCKTGGDRHVDERGKLSRGKEEALVLYRALFVLFYGSIVAYHPHLRCESLGLILHFFPGFFAHRLMQNSK